MLRVAVLTGCRSDYGLLRPLLRLLDDEPGVEPDVYAAAGHLAVSRGLTVELVEADGFRPRRLAPLDEADDSPTGMAALAGRICGGLAELWRTERPHWLVVLGDRVEVLGAATAAWYSRVALAQLQAGDRSRVDDGPRHAVSRLAHLLFPATVAAEERLLAWGEEPRRVHRVGSMALDHARDQRPLDEAELTGLGGRLGLDLHGPFHLLVYHPLPGEAAATQRGLAACLTALDELNEPVLALHPNADAGGRAVIAALRDWAAAADRRALTANLPPREFVGLLRRCGALVGNSSAGLIEASLLGTPVVNVGRRQEGRERGANVYDHPEPTAAEISETLRRIRTADGLRQRLAAAASPYGDGRAAPRVLESLLTMAPDEDFLSKRLVER